MWQLLQVQYDLICVKALLNPSQPTSHVTTVTAAGFICIIYYRLGCMSQNLLICGAAFLTDWIMSGCPTTSGKAVKESGFKKIVHLCFVCSMIVFLYVSCYCRSVYRLAACHLMPTQLSQYVLHWFCQFTTSATLAFIQASFLQTPQIRSGRTEISLGKPGGTSGTELALPSCT